jgi:hypothetical protein
LASPDIYDATRGKLRAGEIEHQGEERGAIKTEPSFLSRREEVEERSQSFVPGDGWK